MDFFLKKLKKVIHSPKNNAILINKFGNMDYSSYICISLLTGLPALYI